MPVCVVVGSYCINKSKSTASAMKVETSSKIYMLIVSFDGKCAYIYIYIYIIYVYMCVMRVGVRAFVRACVWCIVAN